MSSISTVEIAVPSLPMKLFIQFDDAAIETPFPRTDRGHISATRIHEHGPQEYPKPMAKSQTSAQAAQPAARCVSHELWKRPVRMATMMWHAAMRNAPETRMGLRPAWSTQMTAGMVARNIAIPTTPVARSEMELPVRPRSLKMNGA